MIEFNPYSPLTSIAQSNSDGKSITGDFNTFLSLLTTQLKNQNPLDPIDTNDFTQQLVQFSAVEQAIKTNQNLENLTKLSAASAITGAVTYIGKQVTAAGTSAQLSKGSANWDYQITGKSSAATFTVLDENGKQVYSETQSNPDQSGTYTWNGQRNDGTTAPEGGTYKLQILASDGNGTSLDVSTSFSGIVEGVDLQSSEPVLIVDGKRLKLTEITSVNQQPSK